jgi:hypothetical protein
MRPPRSTGDDGPSRRTASPVATFGNHGATPTAPNYLFVGVVELDADDAVQRHGREVGDRCVCAGDVPHVDDDTTCFVSGISDELQRLRDASGSHSPSVAQLEHALPGLVRVDACFLANPMQQPRS